MSTAVCRCTSARVDPKDLAYDVVGDEQLAHDIIDSTTGAGGALTVHAPGALRADELRGRLLVAECGLPGQ